MKCTCTACGEAFSSTTPFDMHRAGEYSQGRVSSSRRCLDADQMREKGMIQREGVWISEDRPWTSRPQTVEEVTCG
jgi:hypothetical protein